MTAPLDAPGLEVDFLLRRGREFVAVEAKSRVEPPTRPHPGLRAIAELAGVRRRLLVYPGRRRHVSVDGVETLPVQAFLAEVQEGTLFP